MAKSTYIPPEDWTPEQVQAKLENLINHVERLKDDWWDEDLKGLINVHGVFPRNWPGPLWRRKCTAPARFITTPRRTCATA